MEQAIIVALVVALSGVLGLSSAVDNSCNNCLFLTPYIQDGNATEARKLSEVDSKNYLGLKSYSGFITVKEEYNSNLFFWFFPTATNLSETPLIIWLQGGPGFSSLKGLFDIVGPIKVEDGKVVPRNITWASDHSMLFIDNPVGSGFSFTDDERGYLNNEDDIGEQLKEFLLQFLEMFHELRSAPLFVAGESYAGKYVPALAIQIHRHNKKNEEPINLKGIMIGNGLVELRNMMHYTELCEVLGLLEGPQLTHLEALEEQVVQLIDDKKFVDATNKFNETIEFIKKQSGVSIYNYLEESSSAAPEFEAYVNSNEVREQIHVGNATFDYNNQLVYKIMQPDFANSTKPFIEELLEHYGVLSYSGQLDVILAYSLSKHMYATMQWSRRDAYLHASRRRLRAYANGAVVGYKKAGGNFIEILIRGAGHMVPMDQPQVAKFMIDSFIDEFK